VTKDVPQQYDPELLKLLYSGKVMDDEDTVESFSIKDDGYLVLVKQTPGKPKPPVNSSLFSIKKIIIYLFFIFLAKEET
jgi:6-phosphogluconolactonase (cycloisomerase 2 family)